MSGFLKNIRSRRLGIVVGVAAPLMVVAWHLLALAARPPHLSEVVAELGSTMRFVADPSPNHACTRLIFIQATEEGYGVYFSEAPGKRKLLFEQRSKGAGYGKLDESLMGWSPDDKLFAYCRHGSRWEIVICDGNTGAKVEVAPFNGAVSGAAWLSPEVLAIADGKRVLHILRNRHDQWVQPEPFKYFSKASNKLPALPISGFAPFDADSVVWRQGGTLFTCGENADAPAKLWESTPNNTLLDFSCSEARKFLLRCRDTNGEYFAYFYPGNRIAGLTRINREELRPNHLSLINDGAGYAFLTQTGSRPDTLVIKPDDSHPSAEIQWQDQVRYFTAGKAALYVVSSLNDQPPGIWRYDLASGSTECVVANVEKPFRYALNSRMTTETLTNGTGEQLTCYLLSPAHLMGKVKHPLVIGILGNQEMGFSWSANHEAIANCGAYFVNVDRHERDASKWADDAFAAYEALAKRPEIDTNQAVVIGRVHALEGGGTKSGWQAAHRGVGQDLDASV